MPSRTPLDDLSEAELVERFRAGGAPRYFEELYRRTRRAVFGLCLRYLRDAARAEDLCHEAFLRAWRAFGDLEGTAFRAWVCRIARNLSINALRHAAVVERSAPLLSAPPPPPSAADTGLVHRERLAEAAAIIRELSPDQRRVFLLRHLEGHSYREIETLTGKEANEVRSLLQNARRNFHLAWEAREEEGGDDGG